MGNFRTPKPEISGFSAPPGGSGGGPGGSGKNSVGNPPARGRNRIFGDFSPTNPELNFDFSKITKKTRLFLGPIFGYFFQKFLTFGKKISKKKFPRKKIFEKFFPRKKNFIIFFHQIFWFQHANLAVRFAKSTIICQRPRLDDEKKPIFYPSLRRKRYKARRSPGKLALPLVIRSLLYCIHASLGAKDVLQTQFLDA